MSRVVGTAPVVVELASCPGKPYNECDPVVSGVECVPSGPCPILELGGAGE